MTPKDKAKELVKKSMPLAHDWEAHNEIVAIKIALLCVDEIINNDYGSRSDMIFWREVKEEIKKL
jgi:hypothetical protein